MDAGFDGVEVHSANGYLLEQFLRDSINDRSDAYGGAIENRTRLLAEVMHAVVAEVGAGRTALRRRFPGAWMVNNGYSREMALQAVASGAADLVAIGRPFIANPDLGRRLRDKLPWAIPDVNTFYGGDAKGYTDYPALAA